MVEAGANFLSEDQMLDAITHAHKLMEPVFQMQLSLQKEMGKTKRPVRAPDWDKDLVKKLTTWPPR